jgi:SEC-C motif-containing protein
MPDAAPCHCRSGAAFEECCEPFLLGRADAPTALALMRSRYTAYATGATGYLLATWHPSTRPDSLTLDPATEWRTLHIVDTVAGGTGDDSGVVEFVARYREDGAPGLLAERSRFVRDAGAWRYIDAVPAAGLGG